MKIELAERIEEILKVVSDITSKGYKDFLKADASKNLIVYDVADKENKLGLARFVLLPHKEITEIEFKVEYLAEYEGSYFVKDMVWRFDVMSKDTEEIFKTLLKTLKKSLVKIEE